MGKGSRQGPTQSTGLNPRDQQYQDLIRQRAQQAAGVAQNTGQLFIGPDQRPVGEQIAPYLNPYLDQVVGGVQSDFDRLRGQTLTAANQDATKAGAFGGSRSGVLAGTRLGEVDRAEANTLGQLRSQGFQNAMGVGLQQNELNRQLMERQAQEPLFRQQQALNFLNLGMGPMGQQSTRTDPRNPFGSALGGAMTGFGVGGPLGGLVGGGLGLLGGLFG